LAGEGQAGLGSAPVEGASARICMGVSEVHSCLPWLAALSKSLGFAVSFQTLSSFFLCLKACADGLVWQLVMQAWEGSAGETFGSGSTKRA